MRARRLSPLIGGLLAVAVAMLGPAAGPRPVLAQESGWTGNLNLFLGVKNLEEDDWEPAETQTEVAAEVDFRPRPWPVNLVVGVRSGQDEATLFDPFLGDFEFESETRELSFGVRKIWEELPTLRPYLGGGLSFIRAEATGTVLGVSVSDSDTGFGFWLGGGLYLTLAEHFNLGGDIRFSRAEATIFDIDVEAGGWHVGLLLGYHW